MQIKVAIVKCFYSILDLSHLHMLRVEHFLPSIYKKSPTVARAVAEVASYISCFLNITL